MNIKNSYGIVNLGNNSTNTINIENSNSAQIIDWNRLDNEIKNLQNAPDNSIQKFASELSEASTKKDTNKLKNTLLKWIPCIGSLIEASYYIIEIASKFHISN